LGEKDSVRVRSDDVEAGDGEREAERRRASCARRGDGDSDRVLAPELEADAARRRRAAGDRDESSRVLE
jgi:hypothetical protein